MDFLQLTLQNLDQEAADAVSDVFNRYGYGGAVVEMLPPNFEEVTVRTIIPFEAKATLREIEVVLALMGKVLPQGLPEMTSQPVGQNDWVNGWKEHFQVVHIPPRVVIQPSWREYTPTSDEIIIHLDPGVAFGSGLHPTTRLCLEILQARPLTGVDMFDVGTGSGILSIAAAKLGAGPIRAVDVDDVAVRVAQENFDLNELDNIQTAVGSAAAYDGRQWSFVMANILSNILIEIMADLKRALAPQGHLILSGIINEQEMPFLAALQAHQLQIEAKHVQGDWLAFVVSHL